MKIISFAETTVALLAGRKTCTRRQWTRRHALQFRQDEIVQAWDKSPRAGGRRVALLQLLSSPVLDPAVPESDWEAEGVAFMEEHRLTLFKGATPRQVWESWARPNGTAGLWVVRFKLMEPLLNLIPP